MNWSLRFLPGVIVAAAAAMCMVTTSSCKDDSKIDTIGLDSVADIPTMLTRNVETLISDSGVTRYKINTPVWYVYDDVQEPYWRFPDGINLIKFDNFFRTETTVRADSAVYFKYKQLWRLDGNVRIINILNEKILTQQLFWDQRTHRIYSDSFVHIEQTDRVLEGLHGFETNEQMTNYRMKQFSGIFKESQFRSNGDGNGNTQDVDEDDESVEETADRTDRKAAPKGAPPRKGAVKKFQFDE